jgi:hypothetical protein
MNLLTKINQRLLHWLAPRKVGTESLNMIVDNLRLEAMPPLRNSVEHWTELPKEGTYTITCSGTTSTNKK